MRKDEKRTNEENKKPKVSYIDDKNITKILNIYGLKTISQVRRRMETPDFKIVRARGRDMTGEEKKEMTDEDYNKMIIGTPNRRCTRSRTQSKEQTGFRERMKEALGNVLEETKMKEKRKAERKKERKKKNYMEI